MGAGFIPKIAWLSRLAFAFVVGFGSGVAIPRAVSSYILKQIEDTVNPLVIRGADGLDRKSTRLNSSHLVISYAVFCLKKKKNSPARDREPLDAPQASRC